jgi:methionyl-tRNA formyltransferase
MKVLFMGTPDFAAGILKAITESKHEVTCVVTQEDKPKGRSGQPAPSPVKECAIEYGIPVFQPHSIKDREAVAELSKYEADIFVVAAYGQILSKEILDMPRYGCINTHASLLPKYRGAAPIQWAIADGEEKTGVTIMQMDEGLDTGDIMYVSEVDITNEDTGESLFNRLEEAGRSLIVEALDRIEAGDIRHVKQDEDRATYARILNKSMGEIDWSRTAVETERLIRAFTPWPGTFTHLRGKVLKILGAEVVTRQEMEGVASKEGSEYEPGCVAAVSKDAVCIATGGDYLKITRLQLEGKKKMDTAEFLKGCRIDTGERLG